jgi:predicted deacylase
MIAIPAAAHSGTEIPATTIEGGQPGPTLAPITGNHGYEYPPILAATVAHRDRRGGTVILVHVANMPSFKDALSAAI